MKWFFKIFVLFIIFQSFQCTDSNETPAPINSEQLATKKQEIQNYISSFSCSAASGCGSIAFGSKACGGPRTYLLFSNEINRTTLEKMVKKYNEMDQAYNIQTNAISDCMAIMPPTEVQCVNGVCTVIK